MSELEYQPLHRLNDSTEEEHISPVDSEDIQQIDDIRKRIEAKTGNKWEFTLRRQGWYTRDQASVTVGDFNKRGPYRVSNATTSPKSLFEADDTPSIQYETSPYVGLEGDYPTIEAIYEKIRTLKRVGSIPGDEPDSWRCPKCSYGNNTFTYPRCNSPYTKYEDRCTYENEDIERWYGVGPNTTCGSIDISSGGSISISTCIAKLTILN